MTTGPIFVVGTMRSGSTLLRLMLDSHDNIAIGPETGFMGALCAVQSIPGWKYGNVWHERLGWSDEELDARLRDFFAEMFERYAAGQGKSRWGDKTPFHTLHITEMARVFPDAQFVGLVRHPGAVATSLRRRFHYAWPDALAYWRDLNAALLSAAADLPDDRFALCRYEDVVADTEPVMRELLGWLGEPWCPAVLAHHETQRERGAPRRVDGGTDPREPIRSSRESAWRSDVSAADEALLRAETRALAEFFGYEIDGSRAVKALAPDGSTARYLLRGAEIAARMRQWPDQTCFSVRPPGPPPDLSREQLVERLAKAEAALARVRARRVVRYSDALRQLQRTGSLREFRRMLHGPSPRR